MLKPFLPFFQSEFERDDQFPCTQGVVTLASFVALFQVFSFAACVPRPANLTTPPESHSAKLRCLITVTLLIELKFSQLTRFPVIVVVD